MHAAPVNLGPIDRKVSRTAQTSTDNSSRKLRFTRARIWKHCRRSVFTPVLAKHSKSFSLIDCIPVGVDRMQRNFEAMQNQVQAWQQSELTDVTAKMIIYEAFVEGRHDLCFEPKYEEFRSRTIWSLSNAFTSAFKELDPISQFKATARLGSFSRFGSHNRSSLGVTCRPPLSF
jgi:hypothetical protein